MPAPSVCGGAAGRPAFTVTEDTVADMGVFRALRAMSWGDDSGPREFERIGVGVAHHAWTAGAVLPSAWGGLDRDQCRGGSARK